MTKFSAIELFILIMDIFTIYQLACYYAVIISKIGLYWKAMFQQFLFTHFYRIRDKGGSAPSSCSFENR